MAKKGVSKRKADSKPKGKAKRKAKGKTADAPKKKTLAHIKENSSSKLDIINEKLDRLMKEHEELIEEGRKLKEEEQKIEALEREELAEERKIEALEEKEAEDISKIEALERRQFDELKNLEMLEQRIEKEVEPHPLAKITAKDFFKGAIGAFIGLVFHLSIVYVLKIAEHISFERAHFFFFLSFLVGAVIMYMTGFRRITHPRLLVFWPLRLMIIYLTALLMSILILFTFHPGYGAHFEESYIQTSVAMILAMIGATTADLIGRE